MEWCVEAHDITFQCSVDAILSFLHDKKRVFSTILLSVLSVLMEKLQGGIPRFVGS